VGFTDAQLMIRLNKHLQEQETSLIQDLGKNWEIYIPDRPDHPSHYFVEDEMEANELAEDESDGEPENDE
jgi:hypothetical protein